MAYAKLQDVTLYYEYEPLPAKPVLLLANSLGTNLSMWDRQCKALSRNFSLLRYDARGHGRSSIPAGPYTIAQMGNDALQLLDMLDVKRAYFCGLSMGGMVGLWLGVHAGARLDRLVVANTAARIGTPEGWNERIALVEREGMQTIVPAVLARWFTPRFQAADGAAVTATAAMLLQTPAAGYTASCAAIRDMDQSAELGTITTPTLVVYGTEDQVTTACDAEVLLAGIASAESLAIEAAHLSNIEAADAFTQGILDFLTQKTREQR